MDSHDGYKWLEATILEVEERREDEFTVPYALVSYRVYRKIDCPVSYLFFAQNNWAKARKDNQGRRYLGFSSRYDEWLPLSGSRIAPHLSKSTVIGGKSRLT